MITDLKGLVPLAVFVVHNFFMNLLITSDIKLIDVPEMQYTSASKPYPCGEIALRGHQVTPGYYKMAEEKYVFLYNLVIMHSAAAFCSDGYFRTGDIGRGCAYSLATLIK